MAETMNFELPGLIFRLLQPRCLSAAHLTLKTFFKLCRYWQLHVVLGAGSLAKGQIQRGEAAEREGPGSEAAGPLCLGAAHTHPSGVSAELTAL